MPDHTLDDFISAFNLVKKGKEFVGPCPVCKDGDRPLLRARRQCRQGCLWVPHCMNKGDDPNSENAKQVFALLTNGHSNGHVPAAPRPRSNNPSQRNHRSRAHYQTEKLIRGMTMLTKTVSWSSLLSDMIGQARPRRSASGYRRTKLGPGCRLHRRANVQCT